MKLKSFLFSVVFLGKMAVPSANYAQLAAQKREVSLSETLRLAVENSAAIKKATIDRQAIEKKIGEERSGIFPQISAGVLLDAYPVLPTQLIPGEFFGQPGEFVPVRFGQPWQLGLQVTAQQNLYNEAARRAVPARHAARALFDILLNKTTEEVKFSVAQLFYQTLHTQQLYRTVDANLQRLEKLEKMLALQEKNGYATSTDVKRVRVAKSNIQFQQQQLTTSVVSLENTLKMLCGVADEEPFNPSEKIENATADSLLWQSMVFDAGLLTEVHLLQKNMDLTRLRSRALRGEKYPNLSAFLTTAYQSQRNDANFFDGAGRWFPVLGIGVRLHVPIFDGFRLKNRVAQADFDWLKMEEDRKQLFLGKKLAFQQAKAQYQLALQNLEQQQQNVALATEILEKLALQHQQGTLPLSDVLAAQTALSEAQTHREQQLFNLQMAKLNLAKAAGRLDLILK